MKGEDVPPNAHWGMNPATEPRPPAPVKPLAEAEPADGFGRIPRWTLEPVAGVGEHREAVPDELAIALRRVAGEMDVPLSTIVHAAHARVLSALTGERAVTTGHGGERPLACHLEADAGSWHALIRSVHLAESADSSEGSFETILDPTGRDGDPPDGAVLRLAVSEHGGDLSLNLFHRRDVLDAGSAARIAGYHLTALRLLAADPEARPAQGRLLSDEELRLQFEGFAGPSRELPDRRLPRALPGSRRGAPRRRRSRLWRAAMDVREPEYPCQPHGTGASGAGPSPRRGRGSGERAKPRVDGRGARDLQSRRRLPSGRAAPPGRSHRGDAVAGRLPARTRRAGRWRPSSARSRRCQTSR